MGFESSIIQAKEINSEGLSSLFWLNIILGIILFIIALIVAPLVSLFYNLTELSMIFSVLSISFIFGSIAIVPRGLLIKNFRFKEQTIVEAISTTFSGVFAVLMAIRGWGYWSLVFMQVSFSFFSSLGYWYTLKWKPQFYFNYNQVKQHLKFSINVFFFNLLNFFSKRSDVLLIGKFLGAEQVGLYMMAYDFIMKPLSQIMNIFSKTIFPILSEHQNDKVKFNNIYIHITYIMTLIIAPILIIIAIIAPLVLPELLGVKWTHAINILQIVSLGAIFTVLGAPVGNIFLAKGRPDLQWKFSLFFAMPFMLLGIFGGYYFTNTALGVAMGYNVALGFILVPGFYIVFSIINLKLSYFFSEIKNLLLSLLIMAASSIPMYLVFYNILSYSKLALYLFAILPIPIYMLVIFILEKSRIVLYKNEFKNIL